MKTLLALLTAACILLAALIYRLPQSDPSVAEIAKLSSELARSSAAIEKSITEIALRSASIEINTNAIHADLVRAAYDHELEEIMVAFKRELREVPEGLRERDAERRRDAAERYKQRSTK